MIIINYFDKLVSFLRKSSDFSAKYINAALGFIQSAEIICFELSVYCYPVGIHILLLIIPVVVSVVVACRNNKCKIMIIVKTNGE